MTTVPVARGLSCRNLLRNVPPAPILFVQLVLLHFGEGLLPCKRSGVAINVLDVPALPSHAAATAKPSIPTRHPTNRRRQYLLSFVDHAFALAAEVLDKLGERRPHGTRHMDVLLVGDVLIVHDVGVHAAHTKASTKEGQEVLLELDTHAHMPINTIHMWR